MMMTSPNASLQPAETLHAEKTDVRLTLMRGAAGPTSPPPLTAHVQHNRQPCNLEQAPQSTICRLCSGSASANNNTRGKAGGRRQRHAVPSLTCPGSMTLATLRAQMAAVTVPESKPRCCYSARWRTFSTTPVPAACRNRLCGCCRRSGATGMTCVGCCCL